MIEILWHEDNIPERPGDYAVGGNISLFLPFWDCSAAMFMTDFRLGNHVKSQFLYSTYLHKLVAPVTNYSVGPFLPVFTCSRTSVIVAPRRKGIYLCPPNRYVGCRLAHLECPFQEKRKERCTFLLDPQLYST